MSKQYIVASKHKRTGEMSMAAHPRLHETLASAEKEAERLAALSKEKKFVVLVVGRVYEAVEVRQTTL